MNRKRYSWLYDVLFLLVFLLAGYLRLTGVNWGEGQNQHPDENFLSGVLGSLQAHRCADPAISLDACPPDQRRWLSIGDYFNSKTSTLNPYNRGFTFYVYGDLPMTIVRVAAEASHQFSDFYIEFLRDPYVKFLRSVAEIANKFKLNTIGHRLSTLADRSAAEVSSQVDVRMLGRQFSALADLFTILILYLIVARLYDRRVALLAALFSALTVMQIQQSHFFTTDLFVNPFAFLAIYFAVAIADDREQRTENREQKVESSETVDESTFAVTATQVTTLKSLFSNHLFLSSLGFGVAYGMALACKVNIYPLAVLLPGAFAARYFITDRKKINTGESQQTPLSLGEGKGDGETSVGSQQSINPYWVLIVACLMAGGLAALISFRIFQPYAFDGLLPSKQWIANIQEQRVQATGDADLPWNLQWARRSHLYSFVNLTVWGLGLPLGMLAWLGFLFMGWRILKGEWRHALLWGWTTAYFGWQSLQFNPTMRYQLPIYPLLVMMAAWFIFELAGSNVQAFKRFNVPKILAALLGITVVALTAAWAFAFHSIYVRPEPRMAASRWIFQNVPGPVSVQIQTADGSIYNQPLAFATGTLIDVRTPYNLSFAPAKSGQLIGVTFPFVDETEAASSADLSLLLSEQPNPTPDTILAQAKAPVHPKSAADDARGVPVAIKFAKPIPVEVGKSLWLNIQTSNGSLTFNGGTIANETDYDYGLPFRVDGYDGFGGIYRGDLNLQVYWDDNPDKLNRFVDTLSQTDYILIPTNHQYAQISRVSERYPLTTLYYRELMGCPPDQEIIPCYYEAKPGDYKGKLGYDLVAVFETYPKLGNFEINDQYAEEAFTFYDHPKVLIFKKNASFNADKVRSILSTVDLTKVVHLTPRQFDGYSNLLMPANRLASQRAGGTWSELFNYDWLQNKYPWLGLLIWYLFIFILGLATYPIIRLAMPGLADKGYPLSRALGLLIFGYLAWLAGSIGIPYIRITIAIVFGGILLTGAILGYLQRDELIEEWRTKRTYFLMIEGLFLAFFLIDFVIRMGNPDLWHPSKGGERPMDFSYFNAVIKSTSFPPYDPWFAGGFINYYYYGFVLVGTPVKLLGIVPSIAYNFILPTLFGMVGICAFSLGWNLLKKDEELSEQHSAFMIRPLSFLAGLSATFLTILLGNLGTIQLLYNRLQQLGALTDFTWTSTFSQRLTWAIQGIALLFKGGTLPIGPGDWYWDPSRVIPPLGGNEITEFPLFTFIYSDLHAHMLVMPIALLAISWALSVVAGRAQWKNQLSAGLGIVIGGLIIGAVYPTNLSDTYTYLLIGIIALGYSTWRYAEVESLVKRITLTVGGVIALYLLSKYLYAPYRAWYSQAYSSLDPWPGPFTPLASYFTHWGLLLFVVVSWMTWETREWLASTPLSALRKLKPYQLLIEGALILLGLTLLGLQFKGTSVGWIALPLAAWAGILLLNPKLPDTKRFVLFLMGTALFITIIVEVFVVRGDIGRANTIFKFYLQAWLMLAVSGGAALAWTLPAFFKWLPGWRAFWQTGLVLLFAGAAMFTITGVSGKIHDRWIEEAPRTLDAMTYMKYAHYDDFGQRLDLSEDYRAIRWMQDHIQGSPVIVEANCPEYRWCTRFTIYTGLPGVVGWNFHQRQQRALTSNWVEERVASVGDFYNTVNPDFARTFLKTYGVKYIIVGQLEHAEYTPQGLAKFQLYSGSSWKSIYDDGSTTIYEVMP